VRLVGLDQVSGHKRPTSQEHVRSRPMFGTKHGLLDAIIDHKWDEQAVQLGD
jgi:hypothetical protein